MWPSIWADKIFVPPPVCVGWSEKVPALLKWLGFTISTPSSFHCILSGVLPLMAIPLAWSLVLATPANENANLAGSKKVTGKRMICSKVMVFILVIALDILGVAAVITTCSSVLLLACISKSNMISFAFSSINSFNISFV